MSRNQNPQQNLRAAQGQKEIFKVFIYRLHGTGRLVSTERFRDLGAHKVLSAIILNMQHDSFCFE